MGKTIREIVKEKILILDGAMGTEIQKYNLTEDVSGPGITTLPLYVYSLIRFGVSPVINSLSFVLILIICIIAILLRSRLKTFAASR